MKKGIGPSALGSPAKLNSGKKKKTNNPLGVRQQMQKDIFEEKQKRASSHSPQRRDVIRERFATKFPAKPNLKRKK